MFDAIIFEKLGVPAVPIITKPFEPTARAIARLHALDDLPCAAVDHPITSLDDGELRARAQAAAPIVEAALLTADGLRCGSQRPGRPDGGSQRAGRPDSGSEAE